MKAGAIDASGSPHARLRTMPRGAVRIAGGVWAERQSVNRRVSLRHGAERLEEAGNFHDLRLAAGLARGEFKGPRYIDSDLYKWLEALAWEIGREPDAELERLMDETVALLSKAQETDGYLNTHVQVGGGGPRWSDIRDGHELYCAGHLIEAAVAHHRVTGEHTLLDVARRFADLIDGEFGPGRREAPTGHPELELALVKLYRTTLERRYLEMAGFFLDVRGRKRLLGLSRKPPLFGHEYYQDEIPLREAPGVAGHCVRQLYLAAAAADIYLETGERALLESCLRLWNDMVLRKMYVTGGVGSRHFSEAFGEPCELPNERAYCETCAAIASVFFNWRLLLATGDARHADLIEHTLYNAFLCGLSADGTRFFYENALLSREGAERTPWYWCACCPPNIMRLLSTLEHYVATATPEGIQIHQYVPASIDHAFAEGRRAALAIESAYPREGRVAIAVRESDGRPWTLSLRVPSWCREARVAVNGGFCGPEGGGPSLDLTRPWKRGDLIELDLPMEGRLIEPHPHIDAARGCVAVARGPIVYCLEQVDQPEGVSVLDARIDPSRPLAARQAPDLLGGVALIEASGGVCDASAWKGDPYRPLREETGLPPAPVTLTFVPYYAWANRERGAMRVWVPLLSRR